MADAKREDIPDCDALQGELRKIVRVQRQLRRGKKAAEQVCMIDIAQLVTLSQPPSRGGSSGSKPKA